MKIHKQISIETDRLILRPFCENDISDIFEYASCSEVTKFLLWEPHKTQNDSKKFLDWMSVVTSEEIGKIFFVYAIECKVSGKVIGSIDFKNTNKYGGQIDYVLSREYWGKGLMTEAARAVKSWAFDVFPEIVRLQAYCLPENTGSKRVMEKIGMECEGVRKKSFVVRDQPVDLAYYALIR